MKKFVMSTQVKIFIAGFCSAVCLVALFLAAQPKMAIGDNDAILRELKGIREDLIPLTALVNIEYTKAQEEAVALNIISSLRDLRDACLRAHEDKQDKVKEFPRDTNIISHLAEYMDGPNKFSDNDHFTSYIAGGDKSNWNSGIWWVGFNLKKAGMSDGVKRKLSERVNVSLVGIPNFDRIPYTDQDTVWMFVMSIR